jgi:hypothetical protein
VRIQTVHFERARGVVRGWREDGFDTVMVVRQKVRASHCYPCRQQDVPEGAVPSWDYYRIPSALLLAETAPTERTASRAELWVAATIAYGYEYPAAEIGAR